MSSSCETREIYTVSLDSVCSSLPTGTTHSQFQVNLPVPLRNVVKAELLMASLHPSNNTYAVTHLYVSELVSNFTTRATLNYTIGGTGSRTTNIGPAASTMPTNPGLLERSFATIPLDTQAQLNTIPGARFVWTSATSFPTDTVYINPIRQLKTLTVTLYDKEGAVQTMTGPTFLTFRFECSKDNVCLY